jgi:hypothetical protein
VIGLEAHPLGGDARDAKPTGRVALRLGVEGVRRARREQAHGRAGHGVPVRVEDEAAELRRDGTRRRRRGDRGDRDHERLGRGGGGTRRRPDADDDEGRDRRQEQRRDKKRAKAGS